MSLGDSFPVNIKKELYAQNLKPGDILHGKFSGVNHPKFFIVTAVCEHAICCCSVYINTDIHPKIKRNQRLLNAQHFLQKKSYNFLHHDSFVNCAYPIHDNIASLAERIERGEVKVIYRLEEEDLNTVRKYIVDSGQLSPKEIRRYQLQDVAA